MPSNRHPDSSNSPPPIVAIVMVVLVILGLYAMSFLRGFAHDAAHRLTRQGTSAPQAQGPVRLPLMSYTTDQVGDRTRNRRLNLVIGGCLNRTSRDVLDSQRRYLGRFGGAPAPVDAEPELLSLTDVATDLAPCEEALRTAEAINPPDPALTAAGSRYLTALRAAAAQLGMAVPYYRNQDWRDDGMARGRAMHPLLLRRFAEFEQAHAALARLVENAQRESPVQGCTSVTQRGLVRCDLARHQALAREVTTTASRARLSTGGTIVDVDLPRFAAQLGALEASVRRISALRESLPRISDAVDDVNWYVWPAEEHLRQAKTLYRLLRDRARVSRDQWTDVDGAPPGSPQRIIEAFNGTVDKFNRP